MNEPMQMNVNLRINIYNTMSTSFSLMSVLFIVELAKQKFTQFFQ